MKKHTKIYCDYFDIIEQDIPLCEFCQKNKMVDVHHISPRGIGGKNPNKDVIENLMGLCRNCHDRAEAKIISKEILTMTHLTRL